VAKAAGILSEDVLLAEDMLQKTRAAKAKTAGKSTTGRARKTPAIKADDKQAKRPAATPRKPAKKP